jgi:ABC-type uncharacterized transport system substrate-binding protein
MNSRNLIVLLMSVFFITLIGAFVWVNSNRPQILVIHSYNTDYSWTRDVNVGIERVTQGVSWVRLRYHYMNVKSATSDAKRRAGIAARKAIDNIRPEVVVAIDDAAQKLAASHYVNAPDLNIVFVGLNGSAKPYGYDQASNVTGIFERKPAAALRGALLLLAPSVGVHPDQGERVRATMLVDSTLSAKRDGEYLKGFEWDPVDLLDVIYVHDFETWKTKVMALKGRTDFLLVGAYRHLKKTKNSPESSKSISPKIVMGWTEKNSPVPVLGSNVFNTQDGAMLSVGVSPYEQGETGMRMAFDIIERKISPDKIPRRISQQSIISLRRSALERRGMEVPQIFESFARATDNYFD